MAARDGTETTERHCGILSRVRVDTFSAFLRMVHDAALQACLLCAS